VPTIFEQDGYRVVVHTGREHGPPHVHVIHGSTLIVISIEGGVARFSRAFRQTPKTAGARDPARRGNRVRPDWGLHRSVEALSWWPS
jgi:hypothetical protein